MPGPRKRAITQVLAQALTAAALALLFLQASALADGGTAGEEDGLLGTGSLVDQVAETAADVTEPAEDAVKAVSQAAAPKPSPTPTPSKPRTAASTPTPTPAANKRGEPLLAELTDSLPSPVTSVVESGEQAIGSVVDVAGDPSGGLTDTVAEVLDEGTAVLPLEPVTPLVDGLLDGAPEAVEDVLDGIEDTGDDVLDAISETGQKFLEGLEGPGVATPPAQEPPVIFLEPLGPVPGEPHPFGRVTLTGTPYIGPGGQPSGAGEGGPDTGPEPPDTGAEPDRPDGAPFIILRRGQSQHRQPPRSPPGGPVALAGAAAASTVSSAGGHAPPVGVLASEAGPASPRWTWTGLLEEIDLRGRAPPSTGPPG